MTGCVSLRVVRLNHDGREAELMESELEFLIRRSLAEHANDVHVSARTTSTVRAGVRHRRRTRVAAAIAAVGVVAFSALVGAAAWPRHSERGVAIYGDMYGRQGNPSFSPGTCAEQSSIGGASPGLDPSRGYPTELDAVRAQARSSDPSAAERSWVETASHAFSQGGWTITVSQSRAGWVATSMRHCL